MIKRGSVLNIDIAVLDAVLFSYFWLDIQSVKEYLMHKEKMSNAVFSENTAYYTAKQKKKRLIKEILKH